jgi:hypothetical protein
VVEVVSTGLAEPRELTTGADGAFDFRDLPEGQYRVTARRGGQAGELAGVARFGPGPFEAVEVRVGPAAVIEGQVVASGAGVPGAWLVLESGADDVPPRRARTDGTGRFRLDGVVPGSWSLDAEATGVWLPAVVAIEAPAGETVTLRVEMSAAATLAGEVVDLAGTPVVGAEISLVGEDGVWSALTRARRRAWIEGRALGGGGKLIPVGELGVVLGPVPFPPPPGASPLLVAAAKESPPDERFVTDVAGRYALTSVRPGKWKVRARHVEFAPGEGEVGQRLVLRRGATLVGTVTDPAGPRVGVRVAAGETTTFTDDKGHFEIPHVLGDVVVRALPRGEDGTSRAVAVTEADEGKTIDASLVLGAPGVGPAETAPVLGGMELEVRDAATFGAIPEFTVRVSGPGAAQSKAGRYGEVQIEALAPGVWKVAVSARGFGRKEAEVSVDAGGVARARFELVQGATVGGTVYDTHGDAVAGAEVSCGGVTGTTSATGAFRLVGVAPGEVAVTARHAQHGKGETWIPLRGGDEVLTVEVRIGP